MKKILLTSLLLILLQHAYPQVIVNLQLPQAGLQLKSQLWQMTLVNTSANVATTKIDMTMTDITNGQVVMTASSNIFTLLSGTKVLQLSDLLPIQYNVLSPAYNINNQPDGFLPVGQFSVCFSILVNKTDVFEKVAEDCQVVEIEPISPPLLTLPSDLSEMDNRRPAFNWMPPAPLNLFTSLSYMFVLTEVQNTQQGTDAIDQNLPLIQLYNVTSPVLSFPASSPALDTGKTYAWQVAAYNNGLFIAKSDVWTFKVKDTLTENVIVSDDLPYYKLEIAEPATYFICNKFLRVEFENQTTDTTATLAFYLIDKNEKKLIWKDEQSTIPVKYGQNLTSIDLDKTGLFTNGKLYQAELVNSRNETLYGRFLYKE